MGEKNFQSVQNWIDAGYPIEPIKRKGQYEDYRKLLDDVADYKSANPDAALDQEAINDLDGAVNYAGERHWTFQWQIILGAIVSVLLLHWWSGSKEEDVAKQSAVVEEVKAWTPSDTVIDMARFNDGKGTFAGTESYEMRYKSAAHFKAYNLETVGRKYYSYQKSIKTYEEASKTGTPEAREKATKTYERLKSDWPKQEKKLLKEYEELSKMDYDATKKMALKEVEKKLDLKKGDGRTVKFWFWFLIICIPLYIFACRPYGYTITRYELEAKTLNGIHRFGLWVSGALAGTAAALQFTTIVTKWSNGSTTKSDDGMGPAIAAAKIALMFGALIVFCFTSCFIMAYATVSGLIRNYDWKSIFAKTQAKLNKQ